MKELTKDSIKNMDELVAACAETGELVYITENGKAKVVAMSVDTFNAIRNKTFPQGNGASANDRELAIKVMNDAFEHGSASTTVVQRRFCVGYARAARIIDYLEERGFIAPYTQGGARKVLVDKATFLKSMEEE